MDMKLFNKSVSSILIEVIFEANKKKQDSSVSKTVKIFSSENSLLKIKIEQIIISLLYVHNIRYEIIILGIIYIDRLILTNQIRLTVDNVVEYLLICIAFSLKHNQDYYDLSGILSHSSILKFDYSYFEFRTLIILDYKLFVTAETFELYDNNIGRHSRKL